MSLTFYFAPWSTASTVHWSLEELGIPYEGVQIDLQNKADIKEKIGDLNPNLKVPVLVHDGVVIFESAAIQIYLGETFGVEKGLFPAAGPARGTAIKWLVWANVSLSEAVQRFTRNTSDRFPAERQNAAEGEQAKKDLNTLIGFWEADLADKPYILGDNASLVDFHLASCFQWISFCGVDLKPFPKVSAWLARCSAREANVKLMAA